MGVYESIERFLFLPDLKLTRIVTNSRTLAEYHLHKTTPYEVCPKCANISHATYDHRKVKIRDEPIRGKNVILVINKRRFWCKSCYKPFTEPISGIPKNGRLTKRFKRSVHNACREFSSLKAVQKK